MGSLCQCSVSVGQTVLVLRGVYLPREAQDSQRQTQAVRAMHISPEGTLPRCIGPTESCPHHAGQSVLGATNTQPVFVVPTTRFLAGVPVIGNRVTSLDFTARETDILTCSLQQRQPCVSARRTLVLLSHGGPKSLPRSPQLQSARHTSSTSACVLQPAVEPCLRSANFPISRPPTHHFHGKREAYTTSHVFRPANCIRGWAPCSQRPCTLDSPRRPAPQPRTACTQMRASLTHAAVVLSNIDSRTIPGEAWSLQYM